MNSYKVPVTVTMTGWVAFQAENMKDAVLTAEHMKGHHLRPAWDSILKGRQESYVVDVENITEEVREAVYEIA